jgi:hypothetical protein
MGMAHHLASLRLAQIINPLGRGRSLGYRASWVWLDLRHHPDRKHVFVWLNPI